MFSYEGHPTLDNRVFRDNWTSVLVGGLHHRYSRAA